MMAVFPVSIGMIKSFSVVIDMKIGMLDPVCQADYVLIAMENQNPSPPRGRPRAFDREAALDKAMRLFWDRGYDATSISDLSASMGINPPSLYAAFGDKKRLFAEAVERYQSGPGSFAKAALDRGGPARKVIATLLIDAAHAFSDPAYPHGCMVVLSATNCAKEADDVAEELRQRRIASETAIRDRIRRAAEDGELADADPEALASFFTAIFQGMSIKAKDGAGRGDVPIIASVAGSKSRARRISIAIPILEKRRV
jgi:TetR/AcrR family transcriptional regulator, copper-responsive repressor